MICAVAFCPHPPVLVPEIAQGAAGELDLLRAACRAAITRIAWPELQIIVVGAGPSAAVYPATARGSLDGFGVELEVPLGSEEPGVVDLPLSLTIGAWLLRETLGPDCAAIGCSIGPGDTQLPPFGKNWPIALLVMGDGSARRSASAPGYFHERAAEFDASVSTALRTGQPELLAVDTALGDALLAAGPRVWAAVAPLLAGYSWQPELLYDDAPYGVGYFVAAWLRNE